MKSFFSRTSFATNPLPLVYAVEQYADQRIQAEATLEGAYLSSDDSNSHNAAT
jgi:hypothetical protein